MKNYSPIAIANWFVLKGIAENNPIDVMKLLKLVYIAQGVALAKRTSLFEEPIEAWQYGPVVESVYRAYKGNGNKPITELTHVGGEVFLNEKDEIVIKPKLIDESQESHEILCEVWEAFSPFSGITLSNWSHDKNGPWYKEWEQNDGKFHKNHPINSNLLADYFKQFIN